MLDENYAKLELFLEEKILPETVMAKQVKNNETGLFDYIPYIQLNELIKLGLNEKEMQHALEYLNNIGIKVIGKDHSYIESYDDYDYLSNYKRTILPERFLTNDEQEKKFALLRATNDSEIREQLTLNNLRIVPYIIWHFFNEERENKKDFEQYGYEGLIYAIDHYIPDKKNKFFSYAMKCVFGHIINGRNEIKGYNNVLAAIAKDIKTTEKEFDINLHDNPEYIKYVGEPGKIRMEFEKKYNRKATNEEIAKILNKPVRYLEDYERKIRFIIQESLDEIIENSDIIYKDNEGLDNIDNNLLKDQILESLSTLPEIEAQILKLRYGIDSDEGRLTLEKTAKIVGLTNERVRQLEALALRRLRHPSRATKLIDYYVDDSEKETIGHHVLY